eukprot:g67229.t1
MMADGEAGTALELASLQQLCKQLRHTNQELRDHLVQQALETKAAVRLATSQTAKRSQFEIQQLKEALAFETKLRKAAQAELTTLLLPLRRSPLAPSSSTSLRYPPVLLLLLVSAPAFPPPTVRRGSRAALGSPTVPVKPCNRAPGPGGRAEPALAGS